MNNSPELDKEVLNEFEDNDDWGDLELLNVIVTLYFYNRSKSLFYFIGIATKQSGTKLDCRIKQFKRYYLKKYNNILVKYL